MTSTDPAIIGPAAMNPRRVPLAIKLIYSAFVAVMLPYYWHAYGPRNFLYFCDVAVLVTLFGIWIESPLLVSLEAVAILLPQAIWLLDVGFRLAGFHLLGLTDYMFDPKIPLFVRSISTFHGWLPLLLLYLLHRLGYDRRALAIQTVIGIALLLICYFGFASPTAQLIGPRFANINYVFGFDEHHAQTKMPPLAWLGILIAGIPAILYLPTHFILRRSFKNPV